jgi:hypothetical protein
MARKKVTENKHAGLFDACPYPLPSKFEIDNFGSPSGVGFARHVIGVVNRIRKIESDLTAEKRVYERAFLEAEAERLYTYLDAQDITALTAAVENWEHVEKEYWVNLLGKQAAIELITVGGPTAETMSKLVRLPEDAYIKATQICVRLANAIKKTTQEAEIQVGIMPPAPSAKDETPATPKKLNLKPAK